ncbi:MAG: response regulator transcription factor [Deltaproteobacteria bacterium]|nr:response regulator transcription factor [Deltaproteobacteria bacterium]
MKPLLAVLADDEKPLLRFLRERLAEVWPELRICGEAENGRQALELIEQLRPEIAFLDIKMPGLTGLEVAERITGTCRVVFVTAYDQYAVEAFEKEAVDYLLKPVNPERLALTVGRLRKKTVPQAWPPALSAETLSRLADALSRREARDYLQYLRVLQGEDIRLIPVREVIYFQAGDKYTRIITAEGETLIRKPIKELVLELDPEQFWQIHRGTIVNLCSVARVSRSLTGSGLVRLKNRSETLKVSSRYLHLFRQM